MVLAGVGAIIGTLLTNWFTYASKSRELDIRMVEISLSILAGENEDSNTLQARRFALRALERYSGVDIPADDFESWALKGEVNFGEITSYTLGTGTRVYSDRAGRKIIVNPAYNSDWIEYENIGVLPTNSNDRIEYLEYDATRTPASPPQTNQNTNTQPNPIEKK